MTCSSRMRAARRCAVGQDVDRGLRAESHRLFASPWFAARSLDADVERRAFGPAVPLAAADRRSPRSPSRRSCCGAGRATGSGRSRCRSLRCRVTVSRGSGWRRSTNGDAELARPHADADAPVARAASPVPASVSVIPAVRLMFATFTGSPTADRRRRTNSSTVPGWMPAAERAASWSGSTMVASVVAVDEAAASRLRR